MKFRTELAFPKYDFEISFNSKLLMIGSCFAESIGNRLKDLNFDILQNPFGIQYNPYSIARALEFCTNKYFFKADDLFFSNNAWHSYMHHSKFSDVSQDECLTKINSSIEKTIEHLTNLDFLIITFGTAKYYSLKSGIVVSNCHKQPDSEFNYSFIDINKSAIELSTIFEKLKEQRPNLKIILTISPIRHVKDGFFENNLSKSHLFMLCNKLIENKNIYYFPSYEILMDELRDYRFYDDDLVHPSKMAYSYIFEKFGDCFFSDETKRKIIEIEKENRRLNHRNIVS